MKARTLSIIIASLWAGCSSAPISQPEVPRLNEGLYCNATEQVKTIEKKIDVAYSDNVKEIYYINFKCERNQEDILEEAVEKPQPVEKQQTGKLDFYL